MSFGPRRARPTATPHGPQALLGLPCRSTVEESQNASGLTPRERDIANLIGLGYTNRQIGVELSITKRTAEAHVQNILNKLGASNRAQIAAWSAQHTLGSRRPPRHVDEGPVATAPIEKVVVTATVKSRPSIAWTTGLLALLAVVIAATADGQPTRFASVADSAGVGAMVFDAAPRSDGEGFGARYVIGDPSASDIRFMKGAVEFVVVKPGGNTGDNLAMESMRRYYTEATLSVKPGSNVEFWINLGSNGYATHIGDHLVDLQTAAELIQFQYANFADNKGAVPLGPQVHVDGLQSGRLFSIAVLVDPPLYQMFLDGRRVVSLEHAPSAEFQQISFAVFGEGGTVRLTSMRVYQLT
jgi:DNA-binding CsgD family transcriptional regulator